MFGTMREIDLRSGGSQLMVNEENKVSHAHLSVIVFDYGYVDTVPDLSPQRLSSPLPFPACAPSLSGSTRVPRSAM